MEWQIKALGNICGNVEQNGIVVPIRPGKPLLASCGECVLMPVNGKLSDSEDSFLYYYTKIDPQERDFLLQVTADVYSDSADVDYQSGFGLLLADTDCSETTAARHRNYLLAGVFGPTHKCGIRIVHGYGDPLAVESGVMRQLDESRVFLPETKPGSRRWTFHAEKTPKGIVCGCDGTSSVISGCDFLTAQDPGALCVGIAAARGVRVHIMEIVFETSPGTMSFVSPGELSCRFPDYPFSSTLLKVLPTSELRTASDLVVSPSGRPDGAGTETSPLDLETALRHAGPGSVVMLLDGVYTPTRPLILSGEQSGTLQKRIRLSAARPGTAILDGSGLSSGAPLLVQLGDHWDFEGLVFRRSPLSGLILCGNDNCVRGCEACENGDTGILIVSYPGAPREKWPARNQIVDCDSHDNCDPVCSNADGFGAKLRIGEGNSFYRCRAFRNIDDGFDLYTKSIYGPTSPVELDNCIAFENGRNDRHTGSGFKLGGEKQPVAHRLWGCRALRNIQYGFSANSNPECRLENCVSEQNGSGDLLPPGQRPLLPRQTARRDKPRGKRPFGDVPEKKNILVLVSSLGGGGAERVACRLANELSRHHQVWLLYYNNAKTPYPIAGDVRLIDASPRRKHRICLRLLHIPRRIVFLLWRARKLRRFQRKNGIQVSISFLNEPNLLNALSSRRCRRILSERNDPSQMPWTYRLKAAFSYFLADHVVFQSEKVRGMFSGVVQKKSSVIPNPTEVSCFAAPKRSAKIVTVARLVEQKNLPLLLNAFALFLPAHPDHTLHLYGDGLLREALQALAEDLGVSDRAFFEGFRSDVHQAIRDAEMFVLSSDFEGLPNALMEAMRMGIPCISTACTGSTDLIRDGENGLLTPLGDAVALAQAMNRLSDDAAMRAALAEQAMKDMQKYSSEQIIKRWERLLY